MRPAIRGKVNQAHAYSVQLARRLEREADPFLLDDGIARLRGTLADLGRLLHDGSA
jgi:hypothetical protein